MYIDFVYEDMAPLKELGIIIPSAAELNLAKDYLIRTRTDENAIQTILRRLQPVKAAFPTTFKFFKAIAETFLNTQYKTKHQYFQQIGFYFGVNE